MERTPGAEKEIRMSNRIWVEEREQKVWLWIAAAFAGFYFGEALLFWGPEPRVKAPPFTPLLYWGAFGVVIVWLVRRQSKKDARTVTAAGVPHGLQSAILGIGITASVVGLAYLVMGVTGNVTLGHAVLLGAMFEAAAIIGGMSGNTGWLAAALVWGIALALVLVFPRIQDYSLGAAMVLGFALIGMLRWSVRTAPKTSPSA